MQASKTTIILSISFLLVAVLSNAQRFGSVKKYNSSEPIPYNHFCIYKTQEDFFSGRETYIGNFKEGFGGDNKFTVEDTVKGGKKKFNLDTMNIFGYTYWGKRMVKVGMPASDKRKINYMFFAGGSPKLFTVLYTRPRGFDGYDKDGYLTGNFETVNTTYDLKNQMKTYDIKVMFIKDVNSNERNEDLALMLSDAPELKHKVEALNKELPNLTPEKLIKQLAIVKEYSTK